MFFSVFLHCCCVFLAGHSLGGHSLYSWRIRNLWKLQSGIMQRLLQSLPVVLSTCPSNGNCKRQFLGLYLQHVVFPSSSLGGSCYLHASLDNSHSELVVSCIGMDAMEACIRWNINEAMTYRYELNFFRSFWVEAAICICAWTTVTASFLLLSYDWMEWNLKFIQT